MIFYFSSSCDYSQLPSSDIDMAVASGENNTPNDKYDEVPMAKVRKRSEENSPQYMNGEREGKYNHITF